MIDRACNHVLHAIARAALRLQGPRAAKRTVQSVARFLPQYTTMHEAREALARLGTTGTCLSRTLTVATRLHDAEVVIGVNPRLSPGLIAHAWLERRDESGNAHVCEGDEWIEGPKEQNLVEEIGRL